MKENKELIIQLLEQDLKHHQLTIGLQKLGLETEEHELTIYKMVTLHMGISEEDETPDYWTELYIELMAEAQNEPISYKMDSMRTLAEKSYEQLCACLRICALKKRDSQPGVREES